MKRHQTFSSIFEFALKNYESNYLNSTVAILNDSLSIDKNFWLWIHDDTIKSIKIDNAIMYKIPKGNILLYDISSHSIKYIDSVYTSLSAIDSIIPDFIHRVPWGGFYIYSDTLKNNNDWISLFLTIKKVVKAYQAERENYSIINFGIKYENLDYSKKIKLIKEIRMPIAVYFKNPFPLPPPMTDKGFKKIMEELDPEKI
jgi:hypothetical protein